jgi:hypothetical protein
MIFARTALVVVLLAGTHRALVAQAPVKPGMTSDQVIAAWGQPSSTRVRGTFTYLSYPSDCMPGCGTQDVVILQDGKVVDAVARSKNHVYDGASTVGTKAPGYTNAAGVTTPPTMATPAPGGAP